MDQDSSFGVLAMGVSTLVLSVGIAAPTKALASCYSPSTLGSTCSPTLTSTTTSAACHSTALQSALTTLITDAESKLASSGVCYNTGYTINFGKAQLYDFREGASNIHQNSAMSSQTFFNLTGLNVPTQSSQQYLSFVGGTTTTTISGVTQTVATTILVGETDQAIGGTASSTANVSHVKFENFLIAHGECLLNSGSCAAAGSSGVSSRTVAGSQLLRNNNQANVASTSYVSYVYPLATISTQMDEDFSSTQGNLVELQDEDGNNATSTGATPGVGGAWLYLAVPNKFPNPLDLFDTGSLGGRYLRSYVRSNSLTSVVSGSNTMLPAPDLVEGGLYTALTTNAGSNSLSVSGYPALYLADQFPPPSPYSTLWGINTQVRWGALSQVGTPQYYGGTIGLCTSSSGTSTGSAASDLLSFAPSSPQSPLPPTGVSPCYYQITDGGTNYWAVPPMQVQTLPSGYTAPANTTVWLLYIAPSSFNDALAMAQINNSSTTFPDSTTGTASLIAVKGEPGFSGPVGLDGGGASSPTPAQAGANDITFQNVTFRQSGRSSFLNGAANLNFINVSIPSPSAIWTSTNTYTVPALSVSGGGPQISGNGGSSHCTTLCVTGSNYIDNYYAHSTGDDSLEISTDTSGTLTACLGPSGPKTVPCNSTVQNSGIYDSFVRSIILGGYYASPSGSYTASDVYIGAPNSSVPNIASYGLVDPTTPGTVASLSAITTAAGAFGGTPPGGSATNNTIYTGNGDGSACMAFVNAFTSLPYPPSAGIAAGDLPPYICGIYYH